MPDGGVIGEVGDLNIPDNEIFEEAIKALKFTIRDDTSLMEAEMPMTLKQYSLRDFDAEGLAEMTEAEMENNAEVSELLDPG